MKAGSGLSGATEARLSTEAKVLAPRTRHSWGTRGWMGSLRPWKKREEPFIGCSWPHLRAEVCNESQDRNLWVSICLPSRNPWAGRAYGREEREKHTSPPIVLSTQRARLGNTLGLSPALQSDQWGWKTQWPSAKKVHLVKNRMSDKPLPCLADIPIPPKEDAVIIKHWS